MVFKKILFILILPFFLYAQWTDPRPKSIQLWHLNTSFFDSLGNVVGDSISLLSSDGVTVLNDGTFKQKVFNNITALKAASADSVGARVMLKQISAAGVGGGIVVYCDSTDVKAILGSAVPNDVTIFSDPVADRVWVRETALQGVVYSRDAGAVGDGSTDDTNALQASINAATAHWVLSPASVHYKITSYITLNSNIVYDFNNQLIKPTAEPAIDKSFVEVQFDSNVVINNYYFDGSLVTPTHFGWTAHPLKIISSRNVRVNNFTILHTPVSGLALGGGLDNVLIDGGYIEGSVYHGILMEDNASGAEGTPGGGRISLFPTPPDSINYAVRITDVFMKNLGNSILGSGVAGSATNAFYLSGAQNVLVSNCEVDSSTGRFATIKTQDYDSVAQHIAFVNNKANNIVHGAFYLRNSTGDPNDPGSNAVTWVKDVKITGNRFVDLHRNFFDSDTVGGNGGGLTDVEITNNYARYKYTGSTNTRIGIDIDAINSTVENNYLEGYNYGIQAGGVCERTYIAKNTLVGIRDIAILVSGDTTIVANNIIDGKHITNRAVFSPAGYVEANNNIIRDLSGATSGYLSIANGNARFNIVDGILEVDQYGAVAHNSAAARFVGDFTLDGTSPDTLTIPDLKAGAVLIPVPANTPARSVIPYFSPQAGKVVIIYSGASGTETYRYVILSGRP